MRILLGDDNGSFVSAHAGDGGVVMLTFY